MLRNHFVRGLALAITLLALATGTSQAAQVVKYDYSAGNYLPSHPSQGSWTVGAVDGITRTLTNNTTDSALEFGDTDAIVGPFIDKTFSPSDYSGNWVMTAEARIDSANSIASWVLIANMGANAWNLWFDGSGSNVISAYDNSGAKGPAGIYTLATVPTMTTAFHKYQLVGNGGSTPTLWIDDVNTGVTAGNYVGGSGNSLSFGANWSGSTQGVANLRVLRLDSDLFQLNDPSLLPEPSSATILALGLLALRRRKR